LVGNGIRADYLLKGEFYQLNFFFSVCLWNTDFFPGEKGKYASGFRGLDSLNSERSMANIGHFMVFRCLASVVEGGLTRILVEIGVVVVDSQKRL
jgi:hypothetical protein